MPGTIMVSVLELMDLPLSSSTSIRASMGKIEYQISDKGNFSFPLTSLRDDLIFKIHDSQENEISSAGIHIRLILEKGVWEDMFPIGGGKLHLKLQVILSDEERERIRMMRQSALKKKHDELHSSNQRGVEGDSGMIIGNAKLPFSTSDEVSESPKQHLQHEEAKLRNVALESLADDKESGTRNVVGSQLEQKLLNSNIADQIKKTSSTKPMSQPLNLIQLQHREDDGLQYSEKKAPPKRTPSNVKKMITAFESGLPKNATYIGTGTEGSKYEKVQDILESKTTTASNNNGDENSGGPFDQVIKAAIIIGFGLLVLLTRQRKKRRKEKNA
ncbi:uncharacterized protein [Cicer arietinum]|uniref:Uncharacterized protein LOC101498984 isoform X3 n=1 Tax=Cicer arietinum TaxID=3827 RepID=A0A1S2XGJ3_CICAR|nr:uncharacterized protein LOC101498984 isoform X3 [Cicer arietinum]